MLSAHGGTVSVWLPPDSGRVYVTRAAYLANCLGEVAGATTACSLRVARMAEQGRIAPQAAAEAQQMLDAADGTARALRARALVGDLTPDAQASAQVARLTTALESLLSTGGGAGAEPPIIGGTATGLAEVEGALQGDRARGLGVVVAPAGVALSSGGATYKFATEPPGAWFIFHQDEASVELGLSALISVPGGEAQELAARRIEDIELLRDDDDAKTARFVVRLADAETGVEADDIDALVTAGVRSDEPWLRVESALRNCTGAPLRASWHWSVSAPWCTDASAGPWRPDADRTVSGAWLYAHRRETGGGGVVLAEWTALRPAHGELLLEPAVAPAELTAGGASRCAWSAAFAVPAWQEDDFLRTRLRWHEQYASLAAQAVTGARLVLRAPGQCVAGVPTRARVELIRPDGPESQAGEVSLRALLADEELPVGVDEATPGRSVFAIDVPASASGSVELRAMASVQADGVPVALRGSEAMMVRPAVELIDVRHCPTPSGELGVVVRLRNHLARVLPVTLDLAVAEPPVTHTTRALLPGESVTSITIEPPGVPIPERASVEATMSVTWESAGVAGRLDHPGVVPLLPTAICEITDSAPLVDGVLDDACWQSASRIESLPDFRSGEPPREATTCLLAADPGGLSIAFICDEAAPAALVTDAVANAWGLSADVTRDDSVEVHLDPRVWG